MVGRGGFEPPKSLTADLQSAPFGHSGTYPYKKLELVDGRKLALQAFRARLTPSHFATKNNPQDYFLNVAYPLRVRVRLRLDIKKTGAGGRTRTPDLLITNQLLYQLSYTSLYKLWRLPLAECLNIISQGFGYVNTFFQFF